MNIEFFRDYSAMSVHGASIVIEELRKKPNLLLCASTGNSPSGLYEELTRKAKSEKTLFQQIKIVKLDEWIGLGKNSKGTCEYYLRKKVIKPLEISEDRYLSFDSLTTDPAKDCKRIQFELQKHDPIDLCVLGLGTNGHIGFNEPGAFVQAQCHVAQLASKTQHHGMIAGETVSPKYGMTLGMGDILSAKKIIMLVSGEGKDMARESLFTTKITTQCPASFLWLHSNVECLVVR